MATARAGQHPSEQFGAETALWRGVIAQAIGDATMPPRPPPAEIKFKGKYKGQRRSAKETIDLERLMAERLEEIREAREWLLGRSKDFGDVCSMAGLDPDAVRERAEALALRGWPAPPPVKTHKQMKKAADKRRQRAAARLARAA